MDLNGFWQVFGVACLGGVAVEAYKWYQLRETVNFPAYARGMQYWLITVVMVLIGGGIAVLYGVTGVNGILALNIGASAPAIIRALAANVPVQLPGQAGAATEGQPRVQPRQRAPRPDDRGVGTERGAAAPPLHAPGVRDFLAGR